MPGELDSDAARGVPAVEPPVSAPAAPGADSFAVPETGSSPRAVQPGLPGEPAAPPDRRELYRALAGYSLLRFGLTAVLTVALMFLVPFLIALAAAIVLQLPLSMLLFPGPQRRVNALLSRTNATRRAERARLRAALRGEDR